MRRAEHATVTSRGPAPELSAAVSLAKAAGITVTAAARHLQNGTARMLIEARVAPRRIEAGHLERIRRLAEIRARDALLLDG
jgi:hypothetical protein